MNNNPIVKKSYVELLLGGCLGGLGNYALKIVGAAAIPIAHLPLYGFLGGLAGVVGVSVFLSRFDKDKDPSKLWGKAIMCGLTFPFILSGVGEIVSLKAENYQLAAENVAVQQQSIAALQDVARSSDDVEATEEALEEIANIAKKSHNPEVIESAIGTFELANNNPENIKLQLDRIYHLEELAMSTDDKEIRNEIAGIILTFQGAEPRINKAAEDALDNINADRNLAIIEAK